MLATQNPIEQEGTYPLPEAQLDRFMFQLRVGYPSRAEEERSWRPPRATWRWRSRRCSRAEQLMALQHLVRRLPAPPVAGELRREAGASTRPESDDATPMVKKYVSWGAGPRASQYLVLGAKARAAMDGRPMPDLEDVNAIAMRVLEHRVVLNFQAEAEGVTAEQVVQVDARP